MADKSAATPVAVDLDRMTVQELATLRDIAEVKRREKLDAAKDAVLAEARTKLAGLGVALGGALSTLNGVGHGRKARRTRAEHYPPNIAGRMLKCGQVGGGCRSG